MRCAIRRECSVRRGGTVGAATAKARLTPASNATSSGSPTCGASKAGLRRLAGQQRVMQCLLQESWPSLWQPAFKKSETEFLFRFLLKKISRREDRGSGEMPSAATDAGGGSRAIAAPDRSGCYSPASH